MSSRSYLPDGWDDLPAVRQSQVFAVDASSYCSRHGPRIATGIEILARIFHPNRVDVPLPAGSVENATQARKTREQKVED